MNYGKLFEPIQIGNMKVKNRIVFSPMGTGSSNPDGTKSESEITYYETRAKGGAGLIILGNQPICSSFAHGSQEGSIDGFGVIPKLTELVERVHRYGTKVALQLTCGTGRNEMHNGSKIQPVSASEVPYVFDKNILCRALKKSEIKEMVHRFGYAAKIGMMAGFDAIEIHAHVGYLMDQFMTPIWNHRNDEYGGSLENRMRFAVETIHAIRAEVGNRVPILFRIALDHCFDGGRTIEESIPILQILEREGIDAIDVDCGSYEAIEYVFPPVYLGEGCMSYVCEKARDAVHIPIMNSGTHNPETAIKLLESGNCDLIMFGRQLVADPFMPNKLLHGLREDVRPCLRCNEDCIGRVMLRLTKISCSVNPQVCEESKFTIRKTAAPKKVLVIGAGPAGLEAARVAAMENHNVTIADKKAIIGGQVNAAATPSFKKPLRDLIQWYGVQLKKLGVTFKPDTEILPETNLSCYDRIIVAVGARSVCPPISGINGRNVVDIVEAHLHPERVIGDRVVICGGGLSGCDYALEAAEEMNKTVTIIEMRDDIGAGFFINTIALKKRLKKNNVITLTGTRVQEIDSLGVNIITSSNEQKHIDADTVITAFGMRPNSSLADVLAAKYPNKVRSIGDCDTVGKIGDAIRSGFYAALALEDELQ